MRREDIESQSDRPIYVISIAAELASVHPQTLRMYERKNLIQPQRSSGRVRLYSDRDIAWIREIQRLTQEIGINLAGVRRVMELQEDLEEAERALLAMKVEAAEVEARMRLEILETLQKYSPQIVPSHRRAPAVQRRRP